MSSLAYPLGLPPDVPLPRPPGTVDPLQPVDVPLPKPPGGFPSPPPPPPIIPAPTDVPGAPTQNPPPIPSMPGGKPPLSLNPQLPQHPATVDPGTLDAQYNAEQAQLAAEIGQRYNDVLKQLGYIDPSTGQFVMGRVETEANRQRPELYRGMDLAAEEQTRQRQAEGTLFSGRRGTEEARAQHPFVQSLADLDIQVPQQLSDLYEQGGNILSEYTNRQNLLLVDAARRRAAALLQSAYPDGTTPPPPTTPPPGDQPPPPETLPPGDIYPPTDPNILATPTQFAAAGGAWAQ